MLRRGVAEGGTPLDLGDVRTFLAVADAGGVSPAARRLGVSKSSVSRRFARLEQALGVIRFATTSWSTTCLGASGTTDNLSHSRIFSTASFTESPCPSQARVGRPIYSLQNLAWAAPRQRLAEPRPSTNVDAMSLSDTDAAYQLRRDRAKSLGDFRLLHREFLTGALRLVMVNSPWDQAKFANVQ